MRRTASSSNRRLAAGCLLLAVALHGTVAGSSLETMEREVTSLYDRSRDAVVKVHATVTTSLGIANLGPRHWVGSGFILDTTGRVVTAATVVEGADTVTIDWQGRRVPAKLLGRDQVSNVAVLQVDPADCVAAGKELPVLKIGNSCEVRVGSMVVAIGFPFEQPSQPVVGFVGGLDIQCGRRVFAVNHIRAGCRLRPGQGGGPLLNTRGEVVGLVVASHGEDECYALPAHAMMRVVDQVVQHGDPRSGWVGLNVTDRPHPGQPSQVQVVEVSPNTPAAAAGFQCRDVLVKIETNEIRRSADVLNTMFFSRSGDKLRMTIVRAGTTQELTVAVGQRPVGESDLPMNNPIARTPAGVMPKIVPVSQPK